MTKNIYDKIINRKPVIIAEAGVNHNGYKRIGRKLIDAAKRAGADCIKFQTYKSNKLTTKKAKRFWSWDGEKKKEGTQHDSYSVLDSFGFKDYQYLYNYCKKKNIEFQSTPFDIDSVKLLEKLKVQTYKIASCDITNHQLIKEVAKTKKPIFLSTGAANISEINSAVKIINKYHKKIIIMQCTLCYPTKVSDANLRSISYLKKKFPKYDIGLSDHTLETLTPALAISMGAMAIEKHFTINKKLKKSADHWLSINEKELSQIVKETVFANQALGKEEKKTLNCEKLAKKNARRSLVSNAEIIKGEKFTLKNLTCKRPGNGIPANKYFNMLGKKAKKNYAYDDLINE
jgi:N,N'-diacetyllegionaminate synthase